MADRRHRLQQAVGAPWFHVSVSGLLLFLVWLAFDALCVHCTTSAGRKGLQYFGAAGFALSPLFLAVVHFHLQRPSRSSVAKAIATSLAACLVAGVLVLTLGLWLHVNLLGGEFI